jgi:hypothetical protein
MLAIANYALARIGKPAMLETDVSSASAVAVSRAYDIVRDEVLRFMNWPTMVRRVSLSLVPDIPWVNAHAYSVGDYVSDSTLTALYVCIAAHTSAAPEATALASVTNWRSLGEIPSNGSGYYQYVYPYNTLKLIEVVGDPYYYREGHFIYSSATDAMAKTVHRVEDPMLWSSTITNVVALRLAMTICYPLTQSMDLYQVVGSEYAGALQMARMLEFPDATPAVAEPTKWSEI